MKPDGYTVTATGTVTFVTRVTLLDLHPERLPLLVPATYFGLKIRSPARRGLEEFFVVKTFACLLLTEPPRELAKGARVTVTLERNRRYDGAGCTTWAHAWMVTGEVALDA